MVSKLSRQGVPERLAPYDLRPDVVAAAAAMASDERSDVQVAALEAVLTESEIVLQMMDGRHDGEMGPPVLTSERILFRTRRRAAGLRDGGMISAAEFEIRKSALWRDI